MKKKIKVLVLSDHPFSPSGVGTQSRYIIESLLNTGDYSFVCLGGAIKHKDYSPQKVDQFGDDLVIYPVDGYGTQETVRSVIRTAKPDMLWFMTDPRFFPWLWEIEDEIRSLIPMVYYHVWDNYPYPKYNKTWYDSTDVVVAISKVAFDIVKTVSPDIETHYLPHSVDPKYFTKMNNYEIDELRENMNIPKDKFVVFWNNRNARRKQPGTLMFWFNEFLEKIGKENAMLIMHTDPVDPNGPNLVAIIEELGLNNGEIQISREKVDFPQLAALYNAADVTVNISDAEGFGLSTLESLSCGTPIIVTMTGGLQEQVTDGKEWFGVGIEPSSKAVIGSQEIPYIYEDRINKDEFLKGLMKIYELSSEDREALGLKGKMHVEKKYNFENYLSTWDKILKDVHKKYGSWDTREHYDHWELIEV